MVSLHSQGLFYGAASLISNKHAITCASIALRFPPPDFKSAYVNVGSTHVFEGVKHYFEDIIYHNSSNPLPNFAILCVSYSARKKLSEWYRIPWRDFGLTNLFRIFIRTKHFHCDVIHIGNSNLQCETWWSTSELINMATVGLRAALCILY